MSSIRHAITGWHPLSKGTPVTITPPNALQSLIGFTITVDVGVNRIAQKLSQG